jgi:DNA repair exonuclease SbcCD nuclease subunit
MPTKIAHISDTHLGKLQYRSPDRRQDYTDAFAEAIDAAIDLDVDAVLHTGDLFDAPNPNVPVVNQCLDIIKKLDAAGIPFLGIVGNHERKRDEQWLDLAKRFDVVERLSRTPRYVGSGEDAVALYGIDAVRQPQWKTTDFQLEEPSPDAYRLLAMHELVSPPVPEHMAHYNATEILDRVGIRLDGIALGDYHEPSRDTVAGYDTELWYPGSTEKTARDESEHHYFSLLTVKDFSLTITRHQLTSPRLFVEFDIDFSEEDGIEYARKTIEKYDFEGDNGKNAVAIAILTGENTGVSPQDIHGLLKKHGAAVTQVVDNRGLISIEDIDLSSASMSEMDDLIRDSVAALDLSETSEQLEALITDADVAKSNIRSEGKTIIDTARQKRGDTQ